MGFICNADIELVYMALKLGGRTLDGLRVAELGNQRAAIAGMQRCTAKEWFTQHGAHHMSFDINGRDGAVAVDLCKPLPTEYLGAFDMVTNYGTTEHLSDQRMVFKNVHDITAVGGMMVHCVPMTGKWCNHCPYHYSPKFMQSLADLNGYTLVFNGEPRNGLLNVVFIKNDEDFKEIDHNLLTYTSHYMRNGSNRF